MGHTGRGSEAEFFNGTRIFSLLGSICVLDSSADIGKINSALSMCDIVYLKPGTYNFDADTDTIVIPSGKRLEGLASAMPLQSNIADKVYLSWRNFGTSHADDAVKMGPRTTLKNVHIRTNKVVASGTHCINAFDVAPGDNVTRAKQWVTIDGVTNDGWFGNVPQNSAALKVGHGRVTNCNFSVIGNGTLGILIGQKDINGNHSTSSLVIEDCRVFGHVAITLDDEGVPRGASHTKIRNCEVGGTPAIEKAGAQVFNNVHIFGCEIRGQGTVSAVNNWISWCGSKWKNTQSWCSRW
jgi:hypothetical protein